MFKNFSLKIICIKFKDLFLRFPLVILMSISGTASVIAMEYTGNDIVTKILLASMQSFTWLLLISLLTEKYNWKRLWSLIGQVLVLILISGYYIFLMSGVNEPNLLRAFIMIVSGLVVTLFLPYRQHDNQITWSYFFTSVRGAVIAGLFSGGLVLGCLAAMFAIFNLFEISNSSFSYIMNPIVSSSFGIFATWYFLASLPKTKEIPAYDKLPKIVSNFLLYICLPLLSLYFVILYIYVGKIVITWNWPAGGVAYWIIGFCTLGMLAYMALYNGDKHKVFVKNFFKTFFIALIPLVVVLFIAIGFRVQNYGITQSRCLVMIGGLCLALMAVYSLFSKAKRIDVLAYAAAILFLLSVVGPWNIFDISLSNQAYRLKNLLIKNQILENNKLVMRSERSISYDESEEIRNITRYIESNNGESYIKDWYSQSLAQDQYALYPTVFDQIYRVVNSAATHANEKRPFSFSVRNDLNVEKTTGINFNVKGYDFLFANIHYYQTEAVEQQKQKFILASSEFGNFQISMNDNEELEILKDNQIIAIADMKKLVRSLSDNIGQADQNQMIIDVDNEKVKLKIIIYSIGGYDNFDSADMVIDDLFFSILGSIK